MEGHRNGNQVGGIAELQSAAFIDIKQRVFFREGTSFIEGIIHQGGHGIIDADGFAARIQDDGLTVMNDHRA